MSLDHGGKQQHVVVVGGGFAGLGCVKRLARDDSVSVTLVDQHNYHQFQPLLYQVATSQLASSDIAFSLRKLFRNHENVDVKLGEVVELDPAARAVTLAGGERFAGDALVVAAGSGRTSSAPLVRRSMRFRSTRSTTRRGCARASSRCSRRRIAIQRSSTRAR